jgi:Peptidase family M1 domain
MRIYQWAIILFLSISVVGQQAPAPNSDPVYQQLRTVSLSGEAIQVSDFELKRDAGTFHLHSGTVCFVAPVQGKITGAVFVGEGTFILSPPQPSESRMLSLLTRNEEFSERFTEMVLRFTDSTHDEIKKAGSPGGKNCDSGPLQDSKNALRHNRMLRYNLDSRILQDVLSSEPGGLFVAFIHGKRYNDKEIFAIDPHGAPPLLLPVAPEEVEFLTYDEGKLGVWTAFHLAAEYQSGAAKSNQKNSYIEISDQQLDTSIEKSGNLIGKATTTVVSGVDGLRVLPLNLYRTLRVQSVTRSDGQPLAFIQEDKDNDANFSVILPEALAAGSKTTITTLYSGKDAVSNEGGGNYYPIARDDWYPNRRDGALAGYSNYQLTFRVPKGMLLVATGRFISESVEGDHSVSVWKSDVPLTVAGFNFGRFKREEGRLENLGYTVQSLANQEPPEWIKSFQHATERPLSQRDGAIISQPEVALGTMSTSVLTKKALGEGELAVQVYSSYFGPLPYDHLSLSQQTASDYGQSWPELVWLPLTYFLDTTTRHMMNQMTGRLRDDPHGYFKVVAPHEVAHQWWGHTVGFGSYRDQWMSEGFADASAALYLQAVYSKEPQRYFDFWNDERQLLTERDKEGFRAIDVGPVTMGYRLSNSRAGFDISRRLLYPKGAYILHMIRMMMTNTKTGDAQFRDLMQDFVKTYMNRAATTEDFKAMVEKHMTSEMDLDGNHRMDWFFNEYVYGTALPSYKLDYSFADASDGITLDFKLTQSNVGNDFRMLVPIYLELADGRLVGLGRARLIGSTAITQKVPLRGVKEKPKRALVNYYYDVLAGQ